MEYVDWMMVALWVVGTSAFGVSFKRYVTTTRDYLLAGRRLRWWQIATAQSADAVDATDFVGVAGHGYRTGMSQVGFAWWGMGIGSVLLSRYITPLLYRTGVYTNAEYLELRYTPSLRIASAILQTLYRFVAMAMVVYAMAMMFNVIIGIGLWTGIWAAMGLTLLYVFTSGQLGVVMAAIPQVVLMLVTAGLVFFSAFGEVGGWQGILERQDRLGDMLHLAGHSEEGVPGGVYLWGLILTLVTYPIINQTVAQRIVSARSEIDARKGTVASLLPWFLITGASVVVGIIAVLILSAEELGEPDRIFPLLMERYLPPGLLGLGVAALVVASMSTGAGIGTAIAGLMTIDVFRQTGRQTADRSRLRMTRVFAALSIVCGTTFAMLIPYFEGMIPFYTALTGTFFLPLTVPYVGGALYKRASRGSGMAALVGGVVVGSILFVGNLLVKNSLVAGEVLPTWLHHPQWRPFWVLGASCVAFVAWSIIENRRKGPIPATELGSILNAFELGKPARPEEIEEMIRARGVTGWEREQEVDYGKVGTPDNVAWYSHPTTFEITALAVLVVLMIWWW
ncbi:MAG: sodium:solute symporter family protein [Planctomycetota bacterium]